MEIFFYCFLFILKHTVKSEVLSQHKTNLNLSVNLTLVSIIARACTKKKLHKASQSWWIIVGSRDDIENFMFTALTLSCMKGKEKYFLSLALASVFRFTSKWRGEKKNPSFCACGFFSLCATNNFLRKNITETKKKDPRRYLLYFLYRVCTWNATTITVSVARCVLSGQTRK